jgi:hypothetical protein
MHRDEEIRPYWGESAEVLPGPSFPAAVEERRGTYEQRRQWFIDENRCPRVGCHTSLDDGACPQCGWTLADERQVGWTPEKKDDYVPTLPLPFDEFAPADTGEAL